MQVNEFAQDSELHTRVFDRRGHRSLQHQGFNKTLVIQKKKKKKK